MQDVDFVEADLSKSDFNGSHLQGATFELTNLTEADFREAENFSINPAKNRMRKAKFRRDNVLGLLDGFGLNVK